MSDREELEAMGLRPWPHENAVPAEADVPIPGGALAVRLPATWSPHAKIEMDDGSIVFVEVPRRGRRYEPGDGRRVALVDRACLAITRRT